MPGDDEPRHARWMLECEHRRPPASNRVRNERRGSELEPVKDVSQERDRGSCEIDAGVVERIGETVARNVFSRAIGGMLEELQPNLWEKKLERLVDYGHSFSPTLEMRALPALLHG